jgi:hypothetical protein
VCWRQAGESKHPLALGAAQSASPTEFPADAKAIDGDELNKRIAGKVFTVKPAQGGQLAA